MSVKKLAVVVFVGLFGAGVAMLVAYFPDLPAEVVTRIESGGPSTLSKAAVAGIFLVVLLACAAYFLGFGLCIHLMPDRYFKVLPNNGYWLAPERRSESLASLAGHLLWLGNATLTMFLATFLLIFEANTGGLAQDKLSQFSNMVTTLYLTYVLFALMVLKHRFGKLPPDGHDEADGGPV